jgi:fatty acid desaturase
MGTRGDRQIERVEWTDLLSLTKRERVNELALSLPWLVGSIYCYDQDKFIPGAICSFLFFLTGLRQSHGAQHYSLGILKGAQEWVLFGLSLLMMGSMHAVQVSHLNHHRHCLQQQDHEGSVAKLRWWEALGSGPLFVSRLVRGAWAIGSTRHRRWIAAELFSIAALLIYAASIPRQSAIACHISAMTIGECFTGFFAVWTVHHDCEEASGRTQRGKWLNRISYNMFFHREHHLYSAVPTAHLDRLARRLDAAGGDFLEVLPGMRSGGWMGIMVKFRRWVNCRGIANDAPVRIED